MIIDGFLYLSGYQPVQYSFAWTDSHQVIPGSIYFITDKGEFEIDGWSEMQIIYALGVPYLHHNDYEDCEIEKLIEISGREVIELAGDTLDTFRDVYVAYLKKEKEDN
jgi:hypothetical protein